jgi:hypothetical protein
MNDSARFERSDSFPQIIGRDRDRKGSAQIAAMSRARSSKTCSVKFSVRGIAIWRPSSLATGIAKIRAATDHLASCGD